MYAELERVDSILKKRMLHKVVMYSILLTLVHMHPAPIPIILYERLYIYARYIRYSVYDIGSERDDVVAQLRVSRVST